MAKKKGRKPYSKRKYYKSKPRQYRNSRDYKSPEYTTWKKAVKERDGFMCQWPGCCSKNKLQVHHIKTWANYPGMRFVVANGITLCRHCHQMIKGKEADYEAFFLKLLEWQMLDKIKKYNKDKNK